MKQVIRKVIRILLLILILTITIGIAQASISGRFPAADAYNGMYIEYQISGATEKQHSDSEDYTTSREITGSLDPGSGTLTVSGTVYTGGGYGADTVITAKAGGKSASKETGFIKSGFPGYNSTPFSVSVPIPPGATSASFSIYMAGSYSAGSRGLSVSGEFTGSGQSAPTSVATTKVTSTTTGGGMTGGSSSGGGNTGGTGGGGFSPLSAAGLGALVIGASAAGWSVFGGKPGTVPGSEPDRPQAPPPSRGAAQPSPGGQPGTTDPRVQDWIESRTVYPGDWKVSPDGRYVYNDVTGPLYTIPVDVITGTSPDPNEIAIFTTDIPKFDHLIKASSITDTIALEDGMTGDTFRDFTNYTWNKNLRENPRKCEDVVRNIAKTIAKGIGVNNVIIDFSNQIQNDDGTFTPVPDAFYDNVTGHIIINPNSPLYRDPQSVIKTVAHEIKHKQQYDTKNPMENPKARNITDINIAHYYVYTHDPGRYAGQYVENVANSFGEEVNREIRAEGLKNERKDLFDFLDTLKNAQNSSFTTIKEIKADQKGFADFIVKNPDLKKKLNDIVFRKAMSRRGL